MEEEISSNWRSWEQSPGRVTMNLACLHNREKFSQVMSICSETSNHSLVLSSLHISDALHVLVHLVISLSH